MSECPKRGDISHIDALCARVRDAGGGHAATVRVLFEVGSELDEIESSPETPNQGAADITHEEAEHNIFEELVASQNEELKDQQSNGGLQADEDVDQTTATQYAVNF